MKFYRAMIIGAVLLASLMGNGGGCCSEDSAVLGPPTESVCPPGGTTLTYNNFGKQFVESYCTKCHASDKVGAARQGAPNGHDFDNLGGIKGVSEHIDEVAASGPAATNETMPPSEPKPTLAERQMLAEWIACGMPEQ